MPPKKQAPPKKEAAPPAKSAPAKKQAAAPAAKKVKETSEADKENHEEEAKAIVSPKDLKPQAKVEAEAPKE